jgi:hypothetical protein
MQMALRGGIIRFLDQLDSYMITKTYGGSQHKMKVWQFIGTIIFWSVICFPIFIEVGGLLGLN